MRIFCGSSVQCVNISHVNKSSDFVVLQSNQFTTATLKTKESGGFREVSAVMGKWGSA